MCCAQGYTFYLAIFYIMVSILFISVAICVWVGWCFMNDSFPFLWPIKVARVVVSLFVSMFYLLSLNVFLVACACNKEDDGHWKHLYFKVGESAWILHGSDWCRPVNTATPAVAQAQGLEDLATVQAHVLVLEACP
jgi:hypothetical protein